MFRLPWSSRPLAACLVALLLLPPGLAAQSAAPNRTIALTGHAGVLAPSQDLFRDGALGGGWEQHPGWQVTGVVLVPLTGRLDGQAAIGWGSTRLEGYGGDAWDGFRARSRLFELTGRLAVRVTPAGRAASLALVAGGGMLVQTFDSPHQNWIGSAGLRSRSWPVGVAGVQGRWRLNEQLSMTLAVEQHFYTASFTGRLASDIAQRDTRASLGVYLPLGWQ